MSATGAFIDSTVAASEPSPSWSHTQPLSVAASQRVVGAPPHWGTVGVARRLKTGSGSRDGSARRAPRTMESGVEVKVAQVLSPMRVLDDETTGTDCTSASGTVILVGMVWPESVTSGISILHAWAPTDTA